MFSSILTFSCGRLHLNSCLTRPPSDALPPGQVNQKVVPMSGLLDPALCRPSPEWSGGDHPGALCDPSVDFHRVSLNKPGPSSLQGKDLVLSNQHGTSRHTHTHMGRHTRTHTCKHTHTHGDTHIHTQRLTDKQAHTQTRTHTDTHTHVLPYIDSYTERSQRFILSTFCTCLCTHCHNYIIRMDRQVQL